jgi:hypothetical protein
MKIGPNILLKIKINFTTYFGFLHVSGPLVCYRLKLYLSLLFKRFESRLLSGVLVLTSEYKVPK